MLHVKNDSPRLKEEFRKLLKENNPLAKLIVDLYHYIGDQFNKDTIITMIYRTQDEQDAIYSGNARYDKKPWTSPHQYWHGVDIRSWLFTDREIDQIVEYLNDKYNKSNYYGWTAKCHKVARGAIHFHIQYYENL